MKTKRKCPWCGRMIELDSLGATDSTGEPLMAWHIKPGFEGLRTPCLGSYRLVTEIENKS